MLDYYPDGQHSPFYDGNGFTNGLLSRDATGAFWPLARPQLSRFSSMRKIGSCKMVYIVVINPIKSYFSALFAVCKGPNLNSNNSRCERLLIF